MKLDLQENMYVRTKAGIIDKIIIDYNGKCNNPNCSCKHVSCACNYYDEKDIIKASFNITDILECGDILSFYEDIDNYKKIYSVGIPDLITLDEIIDKIKNGNIRLIGILTHQQMKQMSYKLGE